MDIENINATEFIAAFRRNTQSGDFKVEFRAMLRALERLPKTEERLAFELLLLARRHLEIKSAAIELFGWSAFYSRAIENQKKKEYLDLLQEAVLSLFKLIGGEQSQQRDATDLKATLRLSLAAVYRLDSVKFSVLVKSLKQQCQDAKLRQLLMRIEHSILSPKTKVKKPIKKTSFPIIGSTGLWKSFGDN